MDLTQEFISRLRRKLGDELAFVDDVEETDKVLAAFDRATLSAVLDNGAVPSGGTALTAHQLRGKKAARTRALNKAKKAKEAVNAGTASNQEPS